MRELLILLLLVASACCHPLDDENTPKDGESCGYDICKQAEPDVLNVHIVPHTHDDVGWLKTVDQYYYGSRNNIQRAGVQYILDSVVKELWEDPKRRFIYVETAFFWKWWVRQSDSVRHKVHTLVRQGRLQFVGGAWSMNDEAATHYQSTIDQFTWGLSKLNDTFGKCGRPHVGWQIDPFGHSREFASFLAQSGFDGLLLGRIDYQDKSARLKSGRAEYLWRGRDGDESSDIFSGVMYNTYSPPPGFCFDVLCSDEPIIDDVDSPMYNVERRKHGTFNLMLQQHGLRDAQLLSNLLQISEFMNFVYYQSLNYTTNNIILTMGGDFTYQDAGMWFTNLDKVIEYTNLRAAQEGLRIKLFYSTPNCYVKAIKDANPTLPIKQDDFFPYASDPHAFWTGYFTSRPTTKYFERQGNNYLQMVKQLQLTAGLQEHNRFMLNELKSAMGVMQHHDAITGTEKQHVTYDYERILDNAIEDALIIARQAFNKITQRNATAPPLLAYDRCRLNESWCHTSETSHNFVVTLYNPLGMKLDATPVRIPVQDGHYSVVAPNGDEISSQLVKIPVFITNIAKNKTTATHELVFIAKHVKPLGTKSFYVRKTTKTKRDLNPKKDANEKYYSDINEYWKNVREDTDLYIKHLEDKSASGSIISDEVASSPEQLASSPHGVMFSPEEVAYSPEEVVNSPEEVASSADGVAFRPDGVMNRREGEANSPDGVIYSPDGVIYSPDGVTYSQDGVNIPDAPVISERNDKTFINKDSKFTDPVLRVLKDNNEDFSYIQELERLIEEAKWSEAAKKVEKRVPFPSLNDEEMRMLSDEPMVVEQYPEDCFLENENIKLRINNTTAEITHYTINGVESPFDIQLHYYPGCVGNNEIYTNRSSGAYIFRPNSTKPFKIPTTAIGLIKGDIVEELHYFSEFASGIIRVYSGMNFVEHDWVVGPIDVTDDIGKEVIVKYSLDIENKGEFYTDSNGRQMLKRIVNKRPEWNLSLVEPIAGNYYPVTNKIYIEDGVKRLSVLTDRSEGGSSINDGEIELMVHRRLLHDDAFGVGEALNEPGEDGKGLIARGKHRILLNFLNDTERLFEEKVEVHKLHLEPQVFVSDSEEISLETWLTLNNCFGGLNDSLPKGVHLLTLEPIRGDKLLLRFENYLDESSANVDMNDLFTSLKIKSMKETALSADRWLEEVKRWQWNTKGDFTDFNESYGNFGYMNMGKVQSQSSSDDGLKIALKAGQIRTFVVEFEYVDDLACVM